MNKQTILLLVITVALAVSCNEKKSSLPILGRKKMVERMKDGKVYQDTIEHTIADFSFYNQDSVLITNQSLDGQIYVADFFFTSCPTICPVMKKQMLRVYDKYKNNKSVSILSHTIDPAYDNVTVLKTFSDALDVYSPKWNFVTGSQEEIYKIGETSYMITAGEDKEAAGGYIHSGAFILVDQKRRIRGVYDGTIPDQVNILLKDMDLLLAENSNEN